jgi:hypothetical protein
MSLASRRGVTTLVFGSLSACWYIFFHKNSKDLISKAISGQEIREFFSIEQR